MTIKNKLNKYALIGLLPLFMSSTASAIVLDFTPSNLGKTGNNAYDSVSMTVDGVTVDITAYTIANDGSGNINTGGLTQITGTGLGVYVDGGSDPSLGVLSSPNDGHKLDGGSSHSTSDLDEGLMFSFSEEVSLDYINFDSFDYKHDDFNLTVDGTRILWDVGSHSSTSSSSLVEYSPNQHDEYLFNNIVGQNFLVWADSNSDAFLIDDMRVSTVSVPEPASLLLLGAGLIGFGVARRKMSA